MRRHLLTTLATAAAATLLLATAPAATAAKSGSLGYTAYHYGSTTDIKSSMAGGQLLSGGGIDDPAAMAWLLGRGGNGGHVDVVVLDAYGPDIYGVPFMGWGADSVDSFIFSSRDGASKPEVLDAIAKAEVIWLDGGDQSNYINYWAGTPLQTAVNARVAQGAAFGGMSAGLAVQGGWVYSALYGSATSAKVLANPYDRDVTLQGRLFDLPLMGNILTDTHFKVRDRMGRLLGFLARLEKDLGATAPLAIAVDEDTSLGLVPKTGDVQVFGVGGGAWMVESKTVTTRTVQARTPLTYGPVTVQHVPSGATFNVKSWSGSGTRTYTLTATNGVISSTAPGGSIY